MVPQDEIVEKLKTHLHNPKNTTKLGLMRFLVKQPVPENLDRTYFGNHLQNSEALRQNKDKIKEDNENRKIVNNLS